MQRDDDTFLHAIEACASTDEAPARALALTLDRFAAQSGTLHLLRAGVLQLEAHAGGLPPQVLAVIREIPVGKGMAGLAVERRAPVTSCNLQTDDTGDVRPGARATGLKGSIVVPLMDGEEAVGALGIANADEREFTAVESALLLEVGRRLGPHLRAR